MRQSRDYMLCQLNGVPYLLPFGQGIADMRRGVRLNDTGAYVWELLAEELSEEEVISRCASHFQASNPELPLLRTDILQFINQLRIRGILEDEAVFPENAADGLFLHIGSLRLALTGSMEYISDAFSPFAAESAVDSASPDQIVEIRSFLPAARPLGKILLRSPNLVVLENRTGYVLLFPSASAPLEAHLSPDGSRVILSAGGSPTKLFLKDIFHAIRLCFLKFAQGKGLFALHSASLLYRDRIWLFSGHSGIGKSTHTNLWREFMHVPLINGDLNLLDKNGPEPMVHGLPWCGTSGISTPGTWPLGGIVFLRKAPCNEVRQLPTDVQQLSIFQHIISPIWTKDQAVLTLDAAKKICSHAPVCRLCCTKDREAVETVRAAMDKWLDGTSS